jgi:hypothetical protein
VASSAWSAARVGLWDAQTDGNLLQIIALPSALTVPSGVILRFPAGAVRLGLGEVPDGIWQGGVFLGPYQEIEPVTFGFPGLTGEHTFHVDYDASDLAGATFEGASTIL